VAGWRCLTEGARAIGAAPPWKNARSEAASLARRSAIDYISLRKREHMTPAQPLISSSLSSIRARAEGLAAGEVDAAAAAAVDDEVARLLVDEPPRSPLGRGSAPEIAGAAARRDRSDG
jgi:hypothetical protein